MSKKSFKDTLKYTYAFSKKVAEYIEQDPFIGIMQQAVSIIQKSLSDNKLIYSKEYFNGQNFTVDVIDGDSKNSIIFLKTNPEITAAKGIEKETNKRYFENELNDKVSSLGIKVSLR